MNVTSGQRSSRDLIIPSALPHADVTRNFVESITSTNGACEATASVVDCAYRRGAGTGSVESRRRSLPTSASVGVCVAGTCAPSAGVEPWSRAVTRLVVPLSGNVPVSAVTRNRYAPGDGMATRATQDTSAMPTGSTGTGTTEGPMGVPSAARTWTLTFARASLIRPPGPTRERITGTSAPLQTDVEATSGWSTSADPGVADAAAAGARG